jgi:hypothetical protein
MTGRGDEVQFHPDYVERFRKAHGVWLDTVLPGTTKCPANYGLKLGRQGNAIEVFQRKFGEHLLDAFREEIANASRAR